MPSIGIHLVSIFAVVTNTITKSNFGRKVLLKDVRAGAQAIQKPGDKN